jgi:hypothetical protein
MTPRSRSPTGGKVVAPSSTPTALPVETKVGATQPEEVRPDAMTPTVAKKQGKVIQKTTPTRRLFPGDLICRDCGEGNPPARKFCRGCGSSLATSATTVETKSWRHRRTAPIGLLGLIILLVILTALLERAV